MLVLTRDLQEALEVGHARVTIVNVRGTKVRLGIEAPRDTSVLRAELRQNTDTLMDDLDRAAVALFRFVSELPYSPEAAALLEQARAALLVRGIPA